MDTVLRDLARVGKLTAERDGHRLLYHLRTEADHAPPPPSITTPAPHPRQRLPLRADLLLTPLEEAVLEVLGKLGNANLDQIYRTLAQSAGASYPEFVLAVRWMVQKGLVILIKERERYFYQAEE